MCFPRSGYVPSGPVAGRRVSGVARTWLVITVPGADQSATEDARLRKQRRGPGIRASRQSARHAREGRPQDVELGPGLAEKQKIKHYYGLGEAQLRRYYRMVVAKKGNTGDQMLGLCERRLDNVVRRAGYTKTRRRLVRASCMATSS